MDFHAVSIFTPPIPNAYAVVAGVSPAFPNVGGHESEQKAGHRSVFSLFESKS
jgi:hypothetical protein